MAHLYDNAMYGAAGLLSIAAVSSFLMRPVNAKWHMKEDADSDAAVATAPPAKQ